jgi:hypothetical protein
MRQADRIRAFAIERYIAPARLAKQSRIVMRAGDVHRDLGLANAMPAVCSAIGSKLFSEEAGVILLGRQGPTNGANVYFEFSLKERDFSARDVPARRSAILRPAPRGADLNLTGAIVLVSCAKRKLAHPAPARLLYCSPWFEKVRDVVEAKGARWFVLSAMHGLVAPETRVAPYDRTLNQMGIAERRAWANGVLQAMLAQVVDEQHLVIFAGRLYREFLEEPLRHGGMTVTVPMEGLRQGEQLAWLSQVR